MPYEEEDTCQQRDESMSHTMLLGACSVKCLGFQGVGGVLHDRTHGPVTNSRPSPRRNAHPISSPPPAPPPPLLIADGAPDQIYLPQELEGTAFLAPRSLATPLSPAY